MQITDIVAHNLSSPIDPPDVREFLGGKRRILKRDVVLVAVETADGEIGYAPAGASSSAMREYFEDASHADFATVLEDRIAPLFDGVTISEPADAMPLLRRETDLPEMIRSQAASAIDVAIFDIVGKRHGAPIYELLLERRSRSAEPTPELPLYASAGMYMSPEGYAEQAAAVQERGFVGYKYRPGGGPDRDRASIRAIRDAVGEDMAIMIDAHTWWKLGDRSYSFETVVDLVEDLAAHEPYWVEEPVPPGDHEAYRELAATASVPIAGGESEESPAGLRRLGETGLAFLQGDVRHHEGYTGCWSIAEWCADRAVTFVPHHFGTDLGLVANAHLVAAAPDADLLEYPVFGDGVDAMYPFPLARDILATPVDIEDGTLSVPDGPGLGVDVNLDVIDDYPYRDGPWTEFIYE